MDRCPCCAARLAGGNVVCPRCQADLGSVISNGQLAERWLARAMRFWSEREPTMAIHALVKSLSLKQTPQAIVFCNFIIRQQGPKVMALLAQGKLAEAKSQLLLLRELQPDNELLKQLQGFTGFLLAKQDGYLHKLLSQ